LACCHTGASAGRLVRLPLRSASRPGAEANSAAPGSWVVWLLEAAFVCTRAGSAFARGCPAGGAAAVTRRRPAAGGRRRPPALFEAGRPLQGHFRQPAASQPLPRPHPFSSRHTQAAMKAEHV
jgi:hypothetical protein